MTDFRALCAELVLAYEKEHSLGAFAIEAEWIARRARAALVQPELEFTAEEVEMIQAPWSYLSPSQPASEDDFNG